MSRDEKPIEIIIYLTSSYQTEEGALGKTITSLKRGRANTVLEYGEKKLGIFGVPELLQRVYDNERPQDTIQLESIKPKNDLGFAIFLTDIAGTAILANELGDVIFALTRPDANIKQQDIGYRDKSSTRFSSAYQVFFEKKKAGKAVDRPYPDDFVEQENIIIEKSKND